MRVRATVTVTIAVAITALSSAAHAVVSPPTTESTVSLWNGDLPEGVTTVQVGCDAEHRPTGDVESLEATLVGTPTPTLPANKASGLHRSALSLSPGAGSVAGFRVTRPSVLDLLTAGVTIYRGDAPNGLSVDLDVTTVDGGWRLSAEGYIPSDRLTFDWAGYDTRGRTYTWTPADGAPSSGTLDDFVAAHGDGAATAYLWLNDCPVITGAAAGPVIVDGLRLGRDAVTTYDVEDGTIRLSEPLAEWVPGTVKRSLHCPLHWGHGPNPVVGVPVVLEARPYGATALRPVGTAITNQYGDAVFHERPRTTTTYRCTYAGGTDPDGQPYPPAQSAIRKLAIPSHLTIRARRTDHGRRVLATGAADPRHPGTKVALHVRRTTWDFGRSKVIDRSRLTRRGTYELTAPLGRGVWELYVTVAKAPGNSSGPSVNRYVR